MKVYAYNYRMVKILLSELKISCLLPFTRISFASIFFLLHNFFTNRSWIYSRLILSSPMIRPNSAPLPWPLAYLVAKTFCIAGGEEHYLPGNQGGLQTASHLHIFDNHQYVPERDPRYHCTACSCGRVRSVAMSRQGNERRTLTWTEEPFTI